MGSNTKMMHVRLAPNPYSRGLMLPKAMRVNISKPATKVPNSTQPKPMIINKPAKQPAKAPFCVIIGTMPMKMGIAMLKAMRSATKNKLMMFQPSAGSFVLSEAMMIAGTFTATKNNWPTMRLWTCVNVVPKISLDKTEISPVWRESTVEATMHTASAKTRPWMPAFWVVSKSKKASALMTNVDSGRLRSWASANMPDKPKRNIVRKMSTAPKAHPFRSAATLSAAYTRCQLPMLNSSAPTTAKISVTNDSKPLSDHVATSPHFPSAMCSPPKHAMIVTMMKITMMTP
mmetsp:Transcript_50727/g.128836  ORF Transcript_50727/g.128836 Transcript_50727/m.128836 type:complete len:288 (-) Transcript_50727:793-1656(-)